MAPDDEPKVKELLAGRSPIDPETQRELERWFGFPSFTQLEEQGTPAEAIDPEMAEVIARRDKALAAVDPTLLEDILGRTEEPRRPLASFAPDLDVHVEKPIARFDEHMVEHALAIAEPREVEIPDTLEDALKECTPQALLRDLHRPELFFDKVFEIVDAADEQRFDIVEEVKSAMATRWQLPPLPDTPSAEARALLDEVRAACRRDSTEVLPHLPNRTVRE